MSANNIEANEIEVRECVRLEEFAQCVELQSSVFGLPEIEISPLRHFVVTKRAGGFTLGAFIKDDGREAGEQKDKLIGFVHQLLARIDGRICGYSHMSGVVREWQNRGVGAQLKWAQRTRSLQDDIDLIKWTFDPFQARNAHFNLNRLGVTVSEYAANFYGTGYHTQPGIGIDLAAIDSDRLIAVWHLDSSRVARLAEDSSSLASVENAGEPVARVEIPADWNKLVSADREHAKREQLRVRAEFEQALNKSLICKGFVRDKSVEAQSRLSDNPCYLFYPASSAVNRNSVII